MRLVRGLDSIVDAGQLAPNDLWSSWMHQIRPYFSALWPYEGFGTESPDDADGNELSSSESPLALLAKLYVPQRREVARFYRPGVSVLPTPVDDPVAALAHFLSTSTPGTSRVLLLTSSPGYGKTTFLHFFFKVWLNGDIQASGGPGSPPDDQSVRSRVLPIFVDGSQLLIGPSDGIPARIHKQLDQFFGKIPELRSLEVRRRWLWRDELEMLREDLQTIEKARGLAERDASEVDELRRLELDVEALNERRARFLADQRNQLIVLVLDNLDQIPIANAREALSCAYAISGRFKHIRIICSVRDYTHPPTRERARLGAFEFEHLTFGPPLLRAVIDRRLEYVIDKLGGARLEARVPVGKVAVTRSREQLQAFMREVQRYLLNDDVLELIDASSNHNVRLALQKVLTILSSPYVDAGKLLLEVSTSSTADGSRLRTSDAWRSLILARASSFQPFSSYFINLFDNGNPKYRWNNVVRVHVLQRLQDRAPGQAISLDRLCDDLGILGHNEREVVTAVHGLILAGVLETWDTLATDFNMAEVEYVAATKAGNFYRDVVSRKFDYLQWISLATFMDEIYRVMDPGPRGNIVDRIRRATALIHHVGCVEKQLDGNAFSKAGLLPGLVHVGMAASVYADVRRLLQAPTLRRFRERPECTACLAMLEDMANGHHGPWAAVDEAAQVG